jgi:hypothetical protein
MKYLYCVLCATLLLFGACKKSNSSSGNDTQLAQVAKVVGVFHLSSFTDPNGDLAVYTPQNSPGTITVTKTDATHFHMVLTTISNGVTTTSANDFVFTEITGDGYVHFNRTDSKATARYVDSVGGLTVEINSPVHEIIVSLRNP